MKFRNILLLSLFFAAGFISNLSATGTLHTNYTSETSLITTSPDDNVITYTVKKGDTVYSIAAAHQTTVAAIYKLNPNAERGIKEGQRLQIPIKREPTGYSNHLIEAKETLYSVARMYRISEEDIKNANTGLDENAFRAGRTIRIPKFDLPVAVSSNNAASAEIGSAYRVQKGETLYSIGKKHSISVESLLNANPSLRQDGLKEGSYIKIPAPNTQQQNRPVLTQEPVVNVSETPYASRGETVRVGVLFPFLDNKGTVEKEKLVEYYEGFLLAVKSLKGKGLNAEIYTFDIGTEKNTDKLKNLLGTNEMKNLHLIIGGVSDKQIDMLAKFSKETGIKYVIPFGSAKESEPTLFQMTSSHSALYPEITDEFVKRYSAYNIIFVSEAGGNKDKSDFTDALKKRLEKSGILSKSVSNSSNLTTDIKNVLDVSRKNILVPLSSSEASLREITAALNSLKTENVMLFGYPEWQVYSQHTKNLHKYEACIYSIFFVDESQWSVKHFADEYNKWYNKKLINSFPKFGYLGYDTGLYFLTALDKFGSSIESRNLSVSTLQSAITFKQSGIAGSLLNKGVYFVDYKKNSGIEKKDIGKK